MYIFAADPNSLASQRNFYDSTNINLAEKDRALRQAAADEERRTYLFQQERDEQRAQQAQADALRYSLGQQELGRRDRDEARRQYEFGIGLAQNKEATDESKRRFGIETGLKEKELAAKNTQTATLNSSKDFNELVSAIQNRDITDEKQIDQLFPALDAAAKARGKAYLDANLKGLATDWQSVNNMASAATALVTTKPVTPKDPRYWFNPMKYITPGPAAPPAEKLSEDDALEKVAQSRNNELLKYIPMIQWNENLQRFTPIIPKPSFNFGATNAPAPLAALTPTAPAVPTAGAPPINMPMFQLAPGTTAPSLMNPPQIVWSSPPSPARGGQAPIASINAPAFTRPSTNFNKGAVVRQGTNLFQFDGNTMKYIGAAQ